MNNTKQIQLVKAIGSLESQLEYIKSLIDDAIPKQEWIDTKEFAERVNLRHRTVTNYAGKGQFANLKKLDTGQYLIHISELEKWGK